jgi:hypothetical protein
MTYRELLRRIVVNVLNLDSEVKCRVIKRGPEPNRETIWVKQVPVNYVGEFVYIEANDIEEAKELP